MAAKYEWLTIGFAPDAVGWDAVYKEDGGTLLTVPIAGWLIQEEREVDDSGRPIDEAARDRRVVAGDMDGDHVVPCAESANFDCVVLRPKKKKKVIRRDAFEEAQ